MNEKCKGGTCTTRIQCRHKNRCLHVPSAATAPDQVQTPGVAAVAAWFDVLESAQDALHCVQYPLRAMELPSYPAGGVCGIANLGIALDHIIAAQNALDLVRDQLSHWKAMTEAYGSSSNTLVSNTAKNTNDSPSQ